MEQSEELNDSLEVGSNAIASVSRVMAMRDDTNAAVIVPFEVESNSQLPTTSVSATASATATTIAENATAADAVIDLCNTSPTPSTSKTAAAAAAAVINLDSSQEEQTHSDEDVAGPAVTIECPICLQTCIHPARLPCGHIFCFLCVKGVAYKNRRCAMCRREIPPEFLDHPDLVNGIDDICATKSTEDGYQWFYEGRNGGWWAYDPRSTKEIEDAYQTRMLGTGTIDLEEDCRHEVLICGAIYTIDFGNMLQHPVQNPTRKRKICRSKHMPTKGWWQYDDRTSQDIEEAFKKGEKSCIILVAGYVYVVDLETMVQQRQNEPSRCRRVKRDLATIPKKGVAGLRIEGNTVITDSNFASQIYQQQQQQSISIGLGAANTPTDSASDLSLPLNYYSMRHPANASDFISTIAATDAAIRIASDIIGSTLAHADELSRNTAAVAAAANAAQQQQQQQHADDANAVQRMSGENTVNYSGSYATAANNTAGTTTSTSLTSGGVGGGGGTVAAAALVAHGSRELLDAAEDLLDATQNVISEADQQTIDLFEQTLNDFHALTLRNLIDSDSDEENGGGDVDGRYAQRHIRF